MPVHIHKNFNTLKSFAILLFPTVLSPNILATPIGDTIENEVHSKIINKPVPINNANSEFTSLQSDVKDTLLIDNTIKHPDIAQFLSPYNYEYKIKKGDNLGLIFEKFHLRYSDLMRLMESDLNFLSLDTIMPGNVIKIWKTKKSNKLLRLELKLNLSDTVSYTLNGSSYDYNTYSDPGTWKESRIKGKVIRTLSGSAKKVGLSNSEIAQMTALLQNKINFSKELKKGDQFEIIRKTQYINGKKTRNHEVEMVKIQNKGKTYSAILHTDGQFYDGDGKSLEQAFNRRPVSKRFRISSSFNPNRLHPVTKRISPHNGTDFAVPSGTPIASVGDGIVILTRKHPYAGNYVVIKHNNTYKTRYLHMSKILVKKGQKITRGQKIGLSGSTGRVTGPHLHFEMLIKDKAVNAMTTSIPSGTPVPPLEMKSFIENKKRLDAI
ncbi:peptidoglycan DD-metalloendopeptidase family protein [Psychromonas sp. SP041]|uniref:peptidoglycan DD-metalloendopeptidase family protein n=1 Tax=Psychromonas sp. SP041 TaxID=1365007 RepID=UPI0010C7B7FF|nr:peptidoglycan DD-metalloendopeptidase family protein [Psychromonas sp. SP041]